MAKRGSKVTFHGAFASKAKAEAKEKKVSGSYIMHKGGRYYVLTRNPISREQITETQQKRYAKRRKYTGQPMDATLIYGNLIEIRAQKTQEHICDAECKRSGHKYVHEFSSHPQVVGLPNGDVLITGRKR